jgi:hypothetical protein
MRTRTAVGIVVGLLVLGSAARADSAPDEERPVPQGPVAAPGEKPCGSCSKRHPILEWLLYRPAKVKCYGRQPACCRPPLYTWFLDYCQAGGGTAYPLQLPPKCD